jgi:predicted MFS family arabinose efflux permease
LGLPNERLILMALCAVQVLHVMDFMVMMPLGPVLLKAFDIGPDRFGLLVSSYGLSAAVAGVAAALFLDRIERRRALLWLFAGFALATVACALAPDYWILLLARTAAGSLGGVAGSVVVAMVADVVPGERRGAAMGLVMAAFPIASVIGVPAGLLLANAFGWHAPFFLIAFASIPVWMVARRVLPVLHPEPTSHTGFAQLARLVSNPVHVRAFALSGFLVFTGSCIIPFFASILVKNGGLPQTQLPLVYFFGGAAAFFSNPWLGRLADRHDKFRMLAVISMLGACMIIIVTRMPELPLIGLLLITTGFMVCMSGRFPPAMAMVTNRIEARDRGGFMSLNSSVHQLGAGVGAFVAGQVIIENAVTGRLSGLETIGWVSLVSAAITLLTARLLIRITPELHLAQRGEKEAATALAESAEGG